MLQRILGVVLVVAGLGAIAFGVASATVLRESDTVVATTRPVGDGTLVVTDPGVLDMVDPDVTVTASVPAGQEVTVVVGRDVDVLGWLEGDAYTRVTGLSDWETLATSQVAGEEPAEDADAAEEAEGEEAEEIVLPDPAGSDMWITELTAAEEVSLRWNDRVGPWMLLAAGTGAAPVEDAADAEADAEDAEAEAGADDAADAEAQASDADAVAPTLVLSWEREVATPWLWPGVIVGGLLLLAGLALLLTGRRKSSKAGSKKSPGRRAVAAGAVGSRSASSASSAPSDSAASPASVESAPSGLTDPAAAVGTALWPAAPAGPAAPPEPAAPVSPTNVSPADVSSPAEASPSAEENTAGTAPVPVTGRSSRRSRLRRNATPPADAPTESPASPPVPDSPAGPSGAAEPPAEPPTTTTGSLPAMPDGRPLTRRELRLREEQRRAAEQSGFGRALRAMTGQTPVVRPTDAAAQPEAPASPTSRRAAAWRETWGFDATTSGQDTQQDDTTEGGTR